MRQIAMLHEIARRLLVFGTLVLLVTASGGSAGDHFAFVSSVPIGITESGNAPAVGALAERCSCSHGDTAWMQGCGQGPIVEPESGKCMTVPTVRTPSEDPRQRHSGLTPRVDPPPPKAS